MSNQSDGPPYPEPYVVPPIRKHKHSLILLHGRGGNGEEFGTGLLTSGLSVGSLSPSDLPQPATLASCFPHAKFIFPSARKRRAKWYNRAIIHQWFDNVPIDEQDSGVTKTQEEWQLEGLRQSRAHVKALIDQEISLVGAANVFIGGLSQGCAMSLHILLSYEGFPPLGGFIGMSGWLPFVDALEDILTSISKETGQDNDNYDCRFSTADDEVGCEAASGDGDDKTPMSPATKACNFVRDNMDLPPIDSSSQPSWLSTPVFLGHGKNDQRVKMGKGVRAADCLRTCGVTVTWREYDEGHWYKVPEQIDDIVEFLHDCVGRQRS